MPEADCTPEGRARPTVACVDLYSIIKLTKGRYHMRVIAGTCRSMPLKTLPGRDTRPTTDRIKETLFNILQNYIPGCRFLDLFAGSGAIGIEALSRGAVSACFVEQSRQAVSVIRDNLRFTKLYDRAEVLQMDVMSAIRGMEGKQAFDVVFMDPPYLKDLERDALGLLAHSSIVTPDTLFVVEASRENDFSWLDKSDYLCIKWKTYKTNEHLFLRFRDGEST
ncbi:MAG: 16S rRNA (guanine(966)-N(2))-methyltransferase RsmD [Lachnospiraceae bacterium]|nr:16S rRNA (guanine(966)-N(2))-methyltransferase RsmD [Lachnospiraceae bacterium]